MNVDLLLGKTTEHLVNLEGTKFFIHKQMLQDFLRLQKAATLAGFDLQVVSAFRDYERQLKIWNAKAKGERPILDENCRPLDLNQMSATEIMYAILRWSAIPGSSRHHWGTDLDIYDAKAQKLDEVQLLASECEAGGPAGPMHEWLDSLIDQGAAFGFYRPYKSDRGGVAPERWHISYSPLANKMLECYTLSLFKKNLEESDLQLKNELLDNAHEIYERFFLNIDLS